MEMPATATRTALHFVRIGRASVHTYGDLREPIRDLDGVLRDHDLIRDEETRQVYLVAIDTTTGGLALTLSPVGA